MLRGLTKRWGWQTKTYFCMSGPRGGQALSLVGSCLRDPRFDSLRFHQTFPFKNYLVAVHSINELNGEISCLSCAAQDLIWIVWGQKQQLAL